MKCKRYILAALLFLFAVLQATAYETNSRIRFEKYSISDGLSHLGVSSFYQDSKGFLWIGTFDGLNRFDGINFKVFKHVPGDPKSLSNNRVRCVLEHSTGKLLIGTEDGICVYDREMEVFEELKFGAFESPVTVMKMFEDSQNRLWILTNRNSVFVLDITTGNQKSLFFSSTNQSDEVVFHDIAEDAAGYIWLASTNGLICYHKDFRSFTLENPPYLNARRIRAMEIDDHNNLWLAFASTVKQVSIEYSEDSVVIQPTRTLKIKSIVTSILSDSRGNIWVSSTNEGVFRLREANDFQEPENCQYHPLIPHTISSNWIVEIYEDHDGNIWFATAEKGIDKFDYSEGNILNFDQSAGLADDYVLDIFQLDTGKLLIGTRRGFSVCNLRKEHIEDVWFDDSFLQDGNMQVSEICRDKNDYLWFGISDGLYYLPPGSSKQPVRLEHQEMQLSSSFIESLIADGRGNIWVGTVSGILRLSFDEQTKIPHMLDFNARTDKRLDHVKVSEFYVDPLDGSLWIGTWYEGLYHLEIKGDEKSVNDFEITHYQYEYGNPETLRSNFVTAILRSQRGDLWIGTEGGGLSVLRHDQENAGFTHFTEKDGLSSNVVKSILEDKNGRLFLGTNYKLNVFDPENKAVTYYDVKDGLKSAFFTKAALKVSENVMVFGGNMGITVLDLTKAGPETGAPVPEFGDFLLSYEKVHPGASIDGNVVLERSLAFADEIELKYFQNTFSIELLGIGFDHPEDSYFRYRLENYNQDWIYTSPVNNMASYANVPPGEYLFEFSISNNINEWQGQPKTMLIKIHPPFWKTWVAYVLYALLFAGVIIIAFTVLLNIERLKSNVQIEKLEKDKEKEVNDTKLRFFTNISHEFKTPVSLILGPAENLLKELKNNERAKYNLLMIHEQANYLLRLINQLLEFRKVEKESSTLKCVEKDMISFVRKIAKSFNPRFYEKGIHYRVLFDVEKLEVWFDPAKVEMIIYNLLSNAYKFTQEGGTVTVRIKKEVKHVAIEVEDNGPGISPEEQPKIFERFYQSHMSSHLKGTGIGLTLSKSLSRLHGGDLTVNSKTEEGATFTLRLPLGKEHLDEEDLIDNESRELEDLVVESDEYPLYQHKTEEVDKEDKDQRQQPTLLIVEDNYRLREYLVGILSEFYNVVFADNGNDGFTMACRHVPVIIVSDVMMPGMDGVQLLKKLKTDVHTSHIPVILLTVKNDFTHHLESLEIGAEDYISKPFHVEHLLVRIKNIIDNRDRLRKRYSHDFKENCDQLDASFSVKDTEFINTLYEIAEENLDNADFSADSFSKAVYMSRTNFYKKLKALTDQTPGEFMRFYRVKRASDLLSTGEYSVSQVTQMIGFKSRSHFYQCFKSIYGKLPSELFNNKK